MLNMENKKIVPQGLLLPFILVTSLFAWWGLANNMTDTLLSAFKKIMSMSDFQTSWIQIAFYGSYFCLALPAAIYIKKFTYKSGILLGLGMYICGALLFYPASQSMQYSFFLVALFILAGGLSILETAANPYIIVMGPEKTGVQRLNFSQSFNPIGSISGVIISKFFILSNLNSATASERAALSAEQLKEMQSMELSAVMGPYVGLAFLLVLLWFAIAFVKMPKASDAGPELNLIPTLRRLIKNKNYVSGVVAQFFYVGAQIGVWSFTIRYVMNELQLNEDEASTYYLAALIVFSVSRFICTSLMKYISPKNLLTGLSILAALSTAIVILVGGMVGVIALVFISACMSLMFPTIYGLAVVGLGDDTKIGGSGLIMAILGGAVLTALQAQMSDSLGSINISYIVPFVCFLVIIFYSAAVKHES